MALRNKVGGAMAVAFNRNGGLEQTIFQIKHWMEMHDMITIGIGPERPATGIGNYWGAAGLQGYPNPVSARIDPKGVYEAVKQDYIGMKAANYLGKRVAELTKIVKAGLRMVEGEICWPPGALTY
jgi:multimeric flavodoxin WrbA